VTKRLHSRYFPVARAEAELAQYVADWAIRHELTFAEATRGLLQAAQEVQLLALRVERHPDNPCEKADEE
jgi:hypothetical protein